MEAMMMMESELEISRIVAVLGVKRVEQQEEKEEEEEERERRVQQQVKKLPMGYRFLPSDVQLINSYLIPKVLRRVLPADVITSSVDVLRTNPWDLPGDSKEKRYFFCKRGKIANRYKIVTGLGYWKATKKEQVICDTNGKAIGLKRRLTFCNRTHNSPTDDRWVMWEYRLATSTDKGATEELGDWMVCAIISEKKNNNGTTRIQLGRNSFETDNVGDGDVIDYCDNQPRYNRCRYNDNIVSIMKNYGTRLAPEESSTSSTSSTLTLTYDEDFFSQGEATSTTCLD